MPPRLCIAPAEFLPVLLGHGSFVRDEDGIIRRDVNGSLLFITPTSDVFLHMKPHLHAQQFWPYDDLPAKTSVVFLAVATNTDPDDYDKITEIGYTFFDTKVIWKGERIGIRGFNPGCQPPGPRGENITKFAVSRHCIVRDATVDNPRTNKGSNNNTSERSHFLFRKSRFIDRKEVRRTLEHAFTEASRVNLGKAAIEKGERRTVILVSLRARDIHPTVQETKWFKRPYLFKHWDLEMHPAMKSYDVLQYSDYLRALDVFGIIHHFKGKDVARNAGNKSGFIMQLMIAFCFLTEEQRLLMSQDEYLDKIAKLPGVEFTINRVNRLHGASEPEPEETAELIQL